MHKSRLKPVMVLLLIFTTTLYSVFPVQAKDEPKEIRVAFLGLKLENLPKEIREVVLWRMNAILETESSILLTKPEAVQLQFGQELIADLVELQQPESFLAFAGKNAFDFVFSGVLTNDSRDENEIFLSGELHRYDVASQHTNRYLINNSMAEFGNELVAFKDKYVRTISKGTHSSVNPLTILLAGGITIAAIFLMRAGFRGGGRDEPEVTPTDE